MFVSFDRYNRVSYCVNILMRHEREEVKMQQSFLDVSVTYCAA